MHRRAKNSEPQLQSSPVALFAPVGTGIATGGSRELTYVP